MNQLAEHMKLVYREFYGVCDTLLLRENLRKREQQHVDVRHIVRTRLAEVHEAGPSEVAKAEGLLREQAPHRSTVIHSFTVANEVLPEYKPALIRLINQIIEETGYVMRDS